MNGFAYSGAIDVAIVTFVNGADNIGIYTPLFAVSDARRLIVLVAVLYVLLAAWCIVGYVIHRQKTVAYSLHGGALARALSSYRPWHLHPGKMRI